MSTPTYDAPALARAPRIARRLIPLQRGVNRVLQRVSLPLLRASLGVTFVWFGALKIADVAPVNELVAGTLPWLDARLAVPALGAFEILIGVVLITGYWLGWVCAAMVAHLTGTFLALVMQPALMFHHGNPLLLTMEGEFVAKNLVLIAAALVVATWSRRR